jgi:hypothetical protein
MLTYWLPDGPCLLPSTGTHQIGVGAFVINRSKEVILLFYLFVIFASLVCTSEEYPTK